MRKWPSINSELLDLSERPTSLTVSDPPLPGLVPKIMSIKKALYVL